MKKVNKIIDETTKEFRFEEQITAEQFKSEFKPIAISLNDKEGNDYLNSLNDSEIYASVEKESVAIINMLTDNYLIKISDPNNSGNGLYIIDPSTGIRYVNPSVNPTTHYHLRWAIYNMIDTILDGTWTNEKDNVGGVTFNNGGESLQRQYNKITDFTQLWNSGLIPMTVRNHIVKSGIVRILKNPNSDLVINPTNYLLKVEYNAETQPYNGILKTTINPNVPVSTEEVIDWIWEFTGGLTLEVIREDNETYDYEDIKYDNQTIIGSINESFDKIILTNEILGIVIIAGLEYINGETTFSTGEKVKDVPYAGEGKWIPVPFTKPTGSSTELTWTFTELGIEQVYSKIYVKIIDLLSGNYFVLREVKFQDFVGSFSISWLALPFKPASVYLNNWQITISSVGVTITSIGGASLNAIDFGVFVDGVLAPVEIKKKRKNKSSGKVI